jgi:hypothetical protein
MHQMLISTNQISSVIYAQFKKLEIQKIWENCEGADKKTQTGAMKLSQIRAMQN